MNRAASRLAQALLRDDPGGDPPITLLFEHGATMIVVIMGVLKAGRMYVPLNQASPQQRLATILADAEATLLVTNNRNLVVAQALAGNGVRVLNLDQIDPRLLGDNPRRPHSLSPDSISNIVYTSDSTGEPKGVIQTHRNLLYEVS